MGERFVLPPSTFGSTIDQMTCWSGRVVAQGGSAPPSKTPPGEAGSRHANERELRANGRNLLMVGILLFPALGWAHSHDTAIPWEPLSAEKQLAVPREQGWLPERPGGIGTLAPYSNRQAALTAGA